MKKKSKTYIGRALSYEMHRAEITQSALAQRAGLPQPTISQLISSAVRVAPASLIALSNCWDKDTNIRVLIAHLRDEVARAGYDPENSVDILPKDGKDASTRAEQNMTVLQRHISDRDVAALIADIARLLKRAEKITIARD